MTAFLHRLRSRGAVIAHDLLMVPLAWLGAYWLRFNLDIPPEFLAQALVLTPVLLLCQGGLFWRFGLYRGVWRFASMPDLVRILKAVAAGGVLAFTVVYLLTGMAYVPRSAPFIDTALLILLLGAPRFAWRWYNDRRHYHGEGRKVLIVGAGHAGETLARDMMRDPGHVYRPVAFVDDDARKRGKDIQGLRVRGGCDDIPAVVAAHGIELVLLALPSASGSEMRRLVGLCERAGVPFRILPRTRELVSGHVGIKELRDVRIEDLLGREAVTLDWQAITAACRGRTILISGGGGSIGAELCRQIARLQPARLVVLERGEFNLYSIDMELRRRHPGLSLTTVLADAGDAVAVERVFREHRPDVVFHAAAYKHVPMLEGQVRAAVMNNVLVTHTLASQAARQGCDAFVLISTDKAVNPGNIMGASKRVAEMICQRLNGATATRYITVRFGNVLASAGSVVPLFQKQIADGGPVTVTDPEITRYFMTIPEAAQLILQAMVLGRGGEILVLDMGEPVKIRFLAEQLILLSGKRPGTEIEIVYTGLRPGEKLHEELFHDAEEMMATAHPKILRARARDADPGALEAALAEMERVVAGGDEARLYALLARLVPEHGIDVRREPVGA